MQPDCTKSPGFLRRAFLAWALALCVLAGQAGAATHELGHALERLGSRAATVLQGDTGVASDACHPEPGERGGCPLHALFTELAAMAFGSWPPVLVEAASHTPGAFPGAPAFPATRLAFHSRAPPALPA